MLASTNITEEALDSPLLMDDGEVNANTGATGDINNYNNQNNRSAAVLERNQEEFLPWMHPAVRYMIYQCIGIRVVADVVPLPLLILATSGKFSFLGLLIIYLVLISMWLPFWLLSFITTEWPIYILFIGSVFFLGRIIIRLLAFPGASHRITGEIEKEFAKYSVRILHSSTTTLIDLGTTIASMEPNAAATNQTYYEISTLWKRAKSYRDRVLAVFYEVLAAIYQEQRQVLPPPQDSNRPLDQQSTPFGNNRIRGDLGNLSGVSVQAKSDGRQLMLLLGKVLTNLSNLEQQGSALLNNSGRFVPQDALTDALKQTAQLVKDTASELRDFLPALAPMSDGQDADLEQQPGEEDGDITMDTVRRHLEEQGQGTTMGAIKAATGSVVSMLDPPQHVSIFGLDVLRGTLLARYKGAEQIWIPRSTGGRIDGICIPALGWDPAKGRNKKAVLYCNPNAGLIEVATGMSLAGGNVAVGEESDVCWADFYTARGYDIYFFNYAGFGRSHATASPNTRAQTPGCLASAARICQHSFIDFKPTPESLKADAITVGNHIITQLGVESLTIHGESIGGMAAAGAACALTMSPHIANKVALLICDRTFANLPSIAQRLVGEWSGPAIEGLTPLWNTDVVSDFLNASCPKVVANDSADSIIADSGSLKSGVALWREVRRETTTKKVGWSIQAPLEYRMADWEEVGVRDSTISPTTTARIQYPTWPNDKNLSLRELFHFAACARRIGKLATLERRKGRTRSDEEHGLELTIEGDPSETTSPGSENTIGIVQAWKALSCCDGLCGATLGEVVKKGYDWTLTWIVVTLVFGGQTVVVAAERRLCNSTTAFAISPIDFDSRPPGYQQEENEMVMHPIPIPEVVNTLKNLVESGDFSLKQVEHELAFCVGFLEYIFARLSSPQTVEASRKSAHFQDKIGHFLDLHCGHNNQYSAEERVQLTALLTEIESRRAASLR